MFDVDIWRPPRKRWGGDWWLHCPINNVPTGWEPERIARKVWCLARKFHVPMLRVYQMLKMAQFGPQGEDLGWSPDKEHAAILKRASEDAALLAMGDALPLEVLVEIWARSRQGLFLACALGRGNHETHVAHHRAERGASILAMKARELIKRQGGEEPIWED
jgi:hypothetical protein